MWLLIAQRLLIDIAVDIIYFPIWWYSSGFLAALKSATHWVRLAHSYLAPGLWLKNLFVPMFGQSDWEGRIVSFFVRLGNVFMRSLMLLLWILAVLAVLLLWPLLPLVVVFFLFQSLG